MARRSGLKRQQTAKKTRAIIGQKSSTEMSKSINARNQQMNEMYEEQAEAKEKGLFEGGWMKVLGTALAFAAVVFATGGMAAVPLIGGASTALGGAIGTLGAGGYALATGAAAGLGTLGGMKMGDIIGGDVEGAYEDAANIDESKLYRGTVGGGYNTLFDPLTSISKQTQMAGEQYGSAKESGYLWGPLTAAVTQGTGSYIKSMPGPPKV